MFVFFYSTIKICQGWKLPTTNEWCPISEKDIALITGGSSGLGQEITDTLLKKYHVSKILLIDIRPPPIALRIPQIDYYQCDIGNEIQLKKVLSEIIKRLNEERKHVSICINNAAMRHSSSLLNLTDEEIHRLLNVNTMSQIWILRLLLDNHITHTVSHSPSAKLFIVTVSSILGCIGPKNLSVYSATKAAISQIHESLTYELAHIPAIRLLLVNTGQLTTNLFQDVKASKLFFAPIVDHKVLANKIVEKINIGEKGVLCAPLYANFLPMIKVFPVFLQDLCRKFAGIDEKVIDSTSSQE